MKSIDWWISSTFVARHSDQHWLLLCKFCIYVFQHLFLSECVVRVTHLQHFVVSTPIGDTNIRLRFNARMACVLATISASSTILLIFSASDFSTIIVFQVKVQICFDFFFRRCDSMHFSYVNKEKRFFFGKNKQAIDNDRNSFLLKKSNELFSLL